VTRSRLARLFESGERGTPRRIRSEEVILVSVSGKREEEKVRSLQATGKGEEDDEPPLLLFTTGEDEFPAAGTTSATFSLTSSFEPGRATLLLATSAPPWRALEKWRVGAARTGAEATSAVAMRTEEVTLTMFVDWRG
jgi:hypothetical protein